MQYVAVVLRWLAFLASLAGLLPVAASASTPTDQRQIAAITDTNVVDVEAGRIIPRQTLIISGERIHAIGPAYKMRVPTGAVVLDGSGGYLIPGLVDTHAHIFWKDGRPDEAALSRLLENGVTTIRHAGAGGFAASLVELRDRAARGEVSSPRISASGMVAGKTLSRYGFADVRTLALHLVSLGVDGLKVRDGLSLEDLRAAIAVGRAAGLPVYGHASDARHMRYSAAQAVQEGLSGVMHMPDLHSGPLPPRQPRPDLPDWQADWLYWRQQWVTVPLEKRRELIRLMVERGVWLEPTLNNEQIIAFSADQEALWTGRGFADEWRTLREGFPTFAGEDLESYRRVYKEMEGFVREFAAAGGTVVTGTDCLPVCGFLQDELIALGDAGLTPAQVLRAATIDAARVLRMKDIGRVAVGSRADLVLLSANPLQDIRNSRKIVAVVQGGQLVARRNERAAFRQPDCNDA